MQREVLARIISAPAAASIDLDAGCADDLLALAKAEGVVALVSRRLAEESTVPASVRDAFAASARSLVAAHLALEAEGRRVLGVIHRAGIPVLLLKGVALGHWLFPAAYLRESSDIDLLFRSRADADRAAAVLTGNGYLALPARGDMAHEFTCRRASPGQQVDLDMHWQLSGMPLFRGLLPFDELLAASIPLPRMAPDARGLGPAHAFAHACMHRASNLCAGLGDRLKWLYDLHLLAATFAAPDWQELLDLCAQRGLCGICAEGIRATAAAFDTTVPMEVLDTLRAGRTHESLDASCLSDWKYMQRRNLAALPSLRARARWLQQTTFPPREYLQELYGRDMGTFALWSQRIRQAFRRLLRAS